MKYISPVQLTLKGEENERIHCIKTIVVCLFLNFSAMAQEDGSLLDTADSININLVSAQTIAEVLDGIGAVRAEAIVMDREENGDFASIEDLLRVKGVGESTLARNSDRIHFVEE